MATRLLFNVDEAAAAMGIGRTMVYKLLMTGELRSIQIGRSRRIPEACVVEFIERQMDLAA